MLNIDVLTYAGNAENLADVTGRGAENGFRFEQVDICDEAAIAALFAQHRPRAVVHFAAESHVDRSIHGPAEFVRTNINGTFNLLQCALAHWKTLSATDASALPLPARVDRRGLRLARPRRRRVQRDDAVRAEQPVLGVEGRVGPSRARVLTTRTACRC